MRLLKSVEELLYELVTWLLFYPLTLWRCLRHPVRMMTYAETELGDRPEEQYADTLSPPIFLLITLFLAHLVGLRFAPPTIAPLPAIFEDERNLLLFRAIAFSAFPLLLALQGVRQRGAKLTRQALKPYFYSQCFPAVPFILVSDIGLLLCQQGSAATLALGGAVMALGLAWYVAVQTTWLVKTSGTSLTKAFLISLGTILLGYVTLIAVAFLTLLAVGG